MDGGAEAQQVVPRGRDALGVDLVGDQRLDERRQRRVVEVPEALVGEVADAGGERQPDQVVGAEEQVGEPGGVGGDLGDVEVAEITLTLDEICRDGPLQLTADIHTITEGR